MFVTRSVRGNVLAIRLTTSRKRRTTARLVRRHATDLVRHAKAIGAVSGPAIQLSPLRDGSHQQLIADALRCEPDSAMPLAALVHDKTGGNPFFAIQFFSALAEEGSLTFDHDTARWSCNIRALPRSWLPS